MPAQVIPWTYTDSPGILMWNWVTEHFVARITGREVDPQSPGEKRNIRAYNWELCDRMHSIQGMPRLLVEGTALAFDEAESRIREHVGKCYDFRLGYLKFAGSLAQTYALASGETVDVGPYVGTRCSVTVLQSDRTERTVAGTFAVDRYRWLVTTHDQQLEIIPEHVVRITNRSEAADRAAAVNRSDTYTGIGRMYREDPRAGCTGRPGFTVGTVDHAGALQCPIHEVGLQESPSA